jgi:hypothetical protein
MDEETTPPALQFLDARLKQGRDRADALLDLLMSDIPLTRREVQRIAVMLKALLDGEAVSAPKMKRGKIGRPLTRDPFRQEDLARRMFKQHSSLSMPLLLFGKRFVARELWRRAQDDARASGRKYVHDSDGVKEQIATKVGASVETVQNWLRAR